MKKILSFLLLGLLLSIGYAWGETYSLTPDQSTTGSNATSYISSLTEFTHSGISWKMNYWNPSTLQTKTNQNSPAAEFRFYNTSAFSGRITKVVITFSALTLKNTENTGMMFLGGTSEVTATTGGTAGTWNSTNKTLTWTPGVSDNFTYFAFYQNGKVATGNNFLVDADAIVVTYEGGSSEEPSISVEATINVSGDETEDVTAISFSNLTIEDTDDFDIQYCDEDGNELQEEPDWIAIDVVKNNEIYQVHYLVDENDGDAARTAYFKVYALDDNAEEVYSDLITITQAKYVPSTIYEKVTSVNQLVPGNEYILVGTTSKVAMGAVNSKIRGYVSVTINNNKVSITDEAVTVLTLGGNTGAWTFLASDNDSYLALTANSNEIHVGTDPDVATAQWTITEDFQIMSEAQADDRYIRYNSGSPRFACYKSGQQEAYLFVKEGSAVNLTLGTNGWSTFAADFNYTVSGATAYKAAYAAGVVTLTEVSVVEAGQGVVLKGENAGDNVTITPSAADISDFSDNNLVGVVSAETAPAGAYAIATLVDEGETEATTKFYPCAGIEIPAHKAYLNTGAATAPSLRIVFAENNTTDIKNLDANENAVKFFENGKLFILRDGVVYDAMGKMVR